MAEASVTGIERTPLTPARWLGQALLYALFAVLIGVFSRWPIYHHLGPDQALIKLSFVHHGARVSECKTQSAAELAKLPPNMRAPMQCPRERVPVIVELDLDGKPVYRHVAVPSGLSRDGASTVYHRVQVSAGEHRIAVRIKDSAGPGGFDHSREATVTVRPAHVLVIDFNAEKGGITLQ